MRAILLDRDGVINRNRADYVLSWEQFLFLPGARWALRRLRTANVPVAIVTNQSAINRGIVTADAVDALHTQMLAAIERAGGGRPPIYTCPHRPDERCPCRKPRPGLLLAACADLGVNPTDAWFIGDSLTDMQAAAACNCPRTLVLTGNGLSDDQTARRNGADGYALASGIGPAVDQLLTTGRFAGCGRTVAC